MTAHMTMYDATVRDSRVKSSTAKAMTTFSDEYVVLVGGLVGHERVLRFDTITACAKIFW